jgi:microcystin-dependent protein
MAEPFVGEIRLFAFGMVPQGWLPCEGQTLPIQQNQVLFSLLGTMYGGNGMTTFQLPDLRGRVPLGMGQSNYGQIFQQAQAAGEIAHTLVAGEIPVHTHTVQASSTTGALSTLQGNYWAGAMNYAPTANGQMAGDAITPSGGNQPHQNMQPYSAVSFCIATAGIYPSRN